MRKTGITASQRGPCVLLAEDDRAIIGMLALVLEGGG